MVDSLFTKLGQGLLDKLPTLEKKKLSLLNGRYFFKFVCPKEQKCSLLHHSFFCSIICSLLVLFIFRGVLSSKFQTKFEMQKMSMESSVSYPFSDWCPLKGHIYLNKPIAESWKLQFCLSM